MDTEINVSGADVAASVFLFELLVYAQVDCPSA